MALMITMIEMKMMMNHQMTSNLLLPEQVLGEGTKEVRLLGELCPCISRCNSIFSTQRERAKERMQNGLRTTAPGGAVGGLAGHRQSMVDNSSQNNPNLKRYDLTLKMLLGVFLLITSMVQFSGNQGWVQFPITLRIVRPTMMRARVCWLVLVTRKAVSVTLFSSSFSCLSFSCLCLSLKPASCLSHRKSSSMKSSSLSSDESSGWVRWSLK